MNAVRIYARNKNSLNAVERYGHVCVLYADRYLIVFHGHNLEVNNICLFLDDLF